MTDLDVVLDHDRLKPDDEFMRHLAKRALPAGSGHEIPAGPRRRPGLPRPLGTALDRHPREISDFRCTWSCWRRRGGLQYIGRSEDVEESDRVRRPWARAWDTA